MTSYPLQSAVSKLTVLSVDQTKFDDDVELPAASVGRPMRTNVVAPLIVI